MNVPNEIDDAALLVYSPIDERHTPTEDAKHYAAGNLTPTPAVVAICRYEDADAFYFFGCDPDWNVIHDSCHLSLEEAKSQAEKEYNGLSGTWQERN